MSKYDEMWKKLGLDLDQRCALLNVLTEVYSDIYLNQQNRPENMSYYDFVGGEVHGLRIQELLEHKKKGGM